MTKRPIFITGIGTGVGKTIVSAILVEKLKADYWKPVQSGELDNSDTMLVRSLISNEQSLFHEEAYRLSQPLSPHQSAALDGIRIDLDKIILPNTENQLIIEGAGGLMVPLNDKDLMIDLIKKLDAEVVLVSKNYLGSINHTLLSAEILKTRNIPIRRLIFCGETNQSSEEVIFKQTGIPIIRIPFFNKLNKASIKEFSDQLIY
ncbi:dethiobiotin synthetase [Daejeonella rubra]|uniref:ATP-dependent dethiobiotin synthetase BioD n=1 Tax=Daejeonella rubra TaxID=990371 RepID=A0A1G9M5R1_9SPHI|nr:dethiobiotin synthase [Daejeonella rubra]SDL69600.1 dethiobiotin synthetase [Daejeonella rubra]